MRIDYLLAVLLINIGCKERTHPVPHGNQHEFSSDEDNAKLQSVWTNTIEYPTIGRAAFVYDQGVVFFTQEAKQQAKDQILALDKTNGDTLWIWDDGPYYTNNRHILNDVLYFTCGSRVYAVDCFTGKTRWKYEPPPHLAYVTLHVSNNHLYVSYQNRKTRAVENETILYELDVQGNATEVYKLSAKERNGYTFNFDHITAYQTDEHHTLLFCESRSWHYGSQNSGRAEYISIDPTRNRIHHDWGNVFNEIDIGGKATIYAQQIIISSGWDQFAAIDIKTNTVNWKLTLPQKLATANLLPLLCRDGNLFVSLGNYGNLNIISANNGTHFKVIKDIGTEWFATAFTPYNNLIWFTTTTGLYAIDSDGNLKIRLENVDSIDGHTGQFTNAFTIDSSTGLMYAIRGNVFICFKKRT